ncbi:MAG: H-NS histone family protein [Zoogloeaceae bacterium]|jgi:DNA-binding protein H-NS|nr:H-NS histone family protein [Zoogloeaceae bacterium]
MVDMSSLSLVELKELERRIPREIKRREAEERQKIRKEVEEYARSKGFPLDELLGVIQVRGTRGKAAPKYRHPQQPDLTWTGRGRKPQWVEAWLRNGGTLQDLAI